MKMTHNQLVAEYMVSALLGEYFVLTEDRIDDLVTQFNNIRARKVQADNPNLPPEELQKKLQFKSITRSHIEQWMEFDPSRNKKYLPWIVRMVANEQMSLPDQGEQVRDDLMTFERLVAIPDYTGPRDIQQFKSADHLTEIMLAFGDLRSKTQIDKEKKISGVEVVAKDGIYTLLKITKVEALTSWAWKAYSASNPNWGRKPILPTDVRQDDLGDGKWCVRFPRYAASYLQRDPFYMVLKNGGPYVGIVWGRGECQDLDNHGITTAMAEEIYPVLKKGNALPGENAGGRNVKVFDNMKFLHGDVKDGDTVNGPVDLANTKMAQLPSNLTVKGTLDLTNCPIAQLPPGLRVEGTLKISGTKIAELPEDLMVEDVEWSEPLTLSIMKHLFYRMRIPEMEVHYKQYLKDSEANRVKDPTTGKLVYPKDEKGKSTKPVSWPVMKKELVGHFQTDPEIDKNVKTLYRYVQPRTPAAAAPEE